MLSAQQWMAVPDAAAPVPDAAQAVTNWLPVKLAQRRVALQRLAAARALAGCVRDRAGSHAIQAGYRE